MDYLRKKGGESGSSLILVHESDRRAYHTHLRNLSARSGLHSRAEYGIDRLYSQSDAHLAREPCEPAGQFLLSTNIIL